MRRAFELAFATCYNFGGGRPKFVEVDDISFLEPVDVGDLMVFHARYDKGRGAISDELGIRYSWE